MKFVISALLFLLTGCATINEEPNKDNGSLSSYMVKAKKQCPACLRMFGEDISYCPYDSMLLEEAKH